MRLDPLPCDEAWAMRRQRDAVPDLDSRVLSIVKYKAPSTTGGSKAAVQSAQTGADALAWAKQVWADQAPARDAAAALDAQGGKVIDVMSMNGKILAGTQALSKRLQRVEKAVA